MKKGEALTDVIIERTQEKISDQENHEIGLIFVETAKEKGYTLKKPEDLLSLYFQQLYDSVGSFTGITPTKSLKTVNSEEYYIAMRDEQLSIRPSHLREYCLRVSDAYWYADSEKFLELSNEDPIKFLSVFDNARHITKMAMLSTGTFSPHTNCIFIDIEKSEAFDYGVIFDISNKTGSIRQAHNEAISAQRGNYKYHLGEELAHSTHSGITKQRDERLNEFMEIYEQFIQNLVAFPENVLNSFLPTTLLIEGSKVHYIPLKDLSKCEKLYIIINTLGLDIRTDDLRKSVLKKLPSEMKRFHKRLTRFYMKSLIPWFVAEGYSKVVRDGILSSDEDYQKANMQIEGSLKKLDSWESSLISYRTLGENFVNKVYETLGRKTFRTLNKELPIVKELNDPSSYLSRTK